MSAKAPPADPPPPGHEPPTGGPPTDPAGDRSLALGASLSAPSWGLAGLGGALVLALLVGAFPPCVFKLAVGAPCPGCGLTRATLALLQLDFPEVFRLHPLAPVIAPLLGWLLLRPLAVRLGLLPQTARWLRGRTLTLVITATVAATWLLYVARLSGALGGHPDPVALGDGWLTRWWF